MGLSCARGRMRRRGVFVLVLGGDGDQAVGANGIPTRVDGN